MSLQNASFAPESQGARCSHHPESRAIATCTRCGNFICKQCYRVGGDGEYYCFECDAKMPNMILAERWDRFLANFADHLVIIFPWFMGAFLGGILSAATGERSSGGIAGGMSMLLGGLASLGVAVYQLYLVSSSGQTIGKRSRGIRVVRTDGSPASLGRILVLRNLVPGMLGSLCGFVGLIDALMIFGEEQRCLHDYLADTKVVKVTSDTRGL